MSNDYILIFILIFIAVSALAFGFYSVFKDLHDLHNLNKEIERLIDLDKQYIFKKLKGDNEDE